MFELGKMRFVTVRSFKGKALIDIREYYQNKVWFFFFLKIVFDARCRWTVIFNFRFVEFCCSFALSFPAKVL